MSDFVGRDCELPTNLAKLNKAKLHTDTHMHTYTDTESALITNEGTQAETSRELGESIKVTQP